MPMTRWDAVCSRGTAVVEQQQQPPRVQQCGKRLHPCVTLSGVEDSFFKLESGSSKSGVSYNDCRA